MLRNFFGVELSLTFSLMSHKLPILQQEIIAPKLEAQEREREKKRHKRDYDKQLSSDFFLQIEHGIKQFF